MKYWEIEEIDLEVIIDMSTITIQKILGKFYFFILFFDQSEVSILNIVHHSKVPQTGVVGPHSG